MPEDFDVRGSVADVWSSKRPPAARKRFDGERYARGGLIGEGGMGRVFIARDRLLDRDVALKECRTGADPDARARLSHEARISARLEHPNILPVYDAGDDDGGTSWFVMRLVRGEPLGARLHGAPLDERLGALRAVLAATEAVAYAHSRGVVHRDLKPDNILVGAFGETLVADWGLAARLDADAGTSGRVGTPGYIAPEQETGAPATPATDVFALGVVLFELATGADVARRAPGPRAPEGQALLDACEAPPELRGIVRRATAADPQARYPTAEALATDLTAFLDGRRVAAHDYSPLELLGRLVRVWRAPLAVGAGALILLVGALVVGYLRTEAQRQRAEEERHRAEAQAERAARSAADALLEQARASVASGALDHGEELARRSLALVPQSPRALGLLASLRLRARPTVEVVMEGPACDAAVLIDQGVVCRQGRRLTLEGTDRTVWTREELDGSPRLLTAGGGLFLGGPQLEELDPATGSTLARWAIPTGAEAVRTGGGARVAWHGTAMAVLGDEAIAAEWCDGASDLAGGQFGTDRLFVICADLRYGFVDLGTPTQPLRASLRQVWAGDGLSALVHVGDDRFALLGDSGAVTVLDATRDVVVGHHAVSRDGLVQGVMHPDGDRIAVRTARGAIHLVDLATSAIQQLPIVGARAVRFLPDGRLEVLAESLTRWSFPDPSTASRIRAVGGVSSLSADPQSGMVAIAQGDGGVALWSPGKELRAAHPFAGVVKNAVWAGDHVLAGASVTSAPSIARVSRTGEVDATEHSAPWRRVGYLDGWGSVGLRWSEREGVVALDPGMSPSHWGAEEYVELATDGAMLALRGPDGAVTLAVAGPEGPAVQWREAVGGAGALAVHRSGTVATGAAGRVLVLGGAHAELDHPERVTALGFSPSGRLVAAGALNGDVRLWRVTDGALLLAHAAHEGRVSGVAFRGEDELITGGWDRTARRWDLSVVGEGTPASGARRSPPQDRSAGSVGQGGRHVVDRAAGE